MTLIEGVGDEVTDFFIVAVVILIGYIAWYSTNISEQPLIRTVLILQHRTRTRIAALRANTSRVDTRNSSAEESSEETIVQSDNLDSNNEAEQNCPDHDGPDLTATPEATGSLATGTSEHVLIEAMDSLNEDTNLLHRPVKLPSSDTTKSEETDQSAPSAPSEPTDSARETYDQDNEITIKLKFINDDQKIVTGRLKEMLSEFKRRHFQVELDAQKRVRLVFNGQVLQPDSETLEKCGLFHNCVVHCLVHQPLLPIPSESTSSRYSGNSNPAFQNVPNDDSEISSLDEEEWDLNRLLVCILTMLLAFAWYCRYHYTQLFTVSTTFALYVLTALFTLALFGNFFPDEESLREVE